MHAPVPAGVWRSGKGPDTTPTAGQKGLSHNHHVSMDGVVPLAQGFGSQLVLGGSGHAGSPGRCKDHVWEGKGDDGEPLLPLPLRAGLSPQFVARLHLFNYECLFNGAAHLKFKWLLAKPRQRNSSGPWLKPRQTYGAHPCRRDLGKALS